MTESSKATCGSRFKSKEETEEANEWTLLTSVETVSLEKDADSDACEEIVTGVRVRGEQRLEGRVAATVTKDLVASAKLSSYLYGTCDEY